MLHNQDKEFTKLEKEIISFLNYQVELTSNISNMGKSATQVASKMMMERSNASRLLNELNRKGVLSKQLGRPVLFFAKERIKDRFNLEYFPSIIEPYQDIGLLIQTTNERKISSDNILEIDKKINPIMYKLLNKVINTFKYPPYGLDVLIYGAEGSGKDIFVHQIFQSCISHKILSSHSNMITIDCSDIEDNDFYTYVLKNSSNKFDRNLIVIQNVEALSEDNKNKLYYLLTNKEKIFRNSVPDLFIMTTQDKTTNIYSKLKYIIPTEIKIPIFEERTIQERLLFITHFFQNEVNILNKPVLIKYNIMNCFLLSSYPINFLQLKKEIQHTLLQSKSTSSFNPYLEITYDDLSDELLENIISNDENEKDIKFLYQALRIHNAMLSPNTVSSFQRALMDDQSPHQKIKYMREKNYDLDSIFFYCKNIIIDTINGSEQELHEENEIQIEFSDFLQKQLPDFFLYKDKKLYMKFLFLILDLITTNDNHEKNKMNIKSLLQGADVELINCVENFYNLKLTNYSKIVIHYYLYITFALINENHISIAIFTNNNKASTFYLKATEEYNKNVKVTSHTLDLINISDEKIYETIYQLHKSLNNGKGVMFLFENEISDVLKQKINALSGLYVESFSSNQLNLLITKAENVLNFIEDLKPYIKSDEFLTDYTDFEDISKQIEDNILNELLTFLNPHKILKSCDLVLANIIDTLNIKQTEKLYIQFITHVSFMVERIKNKNILVHNNTHEYIANNTELIQILEKELDLIARMFDVNIPLSEIIYIADLIKNNEQTLTTSKSRN